MAPKENVTEIKRQLASMQKDIAKVLEMQTQITDLLKHVAHLETENKNIKTELEKKDIKIKELSKKTDDLEQYTRSEDLIISGLRTNHRSYANTARQGNTQRNALTEVIDEIFEFLESTMNHNRSGVPTYC